MSNRLHVKLHNNYSALTQSASTRVATQQMEAKYNDLAISVGKVGKKYSGKSYDQFGNRVSKENKLSSISSSTLLKKGKRKFIGAGYGVDVEDIDEPHVPSHLRAYYAIQRDLDKLKTSTKKKTK